MKNERAITLVSLVITLFILLILAGITINIILGDNGLVNKAQESSNMYTNSYKDEKNLISEYEQVIKNENSLVNKFKHGIIKIGDYVNYEIPAEGSFISTEIENLNSNGFAEQTFDVNNNGIEIKWRILGLGDKDGKLTQDMNKGKHLLLISDNPVQKNININSENNFDKDPYLYMGKAEGYVNASNILNGISNIYVNTNLADGGRSINVEDINIILNVVVDSENNTVYLKNDPSRTNIDLARRFGNVYNYANTDYSATSYAQGKKTAKELGETSVTVNSYAYMRNSITDCNNYNVIESLLFDHISGANEKAYWLNSTAIIDTGNMARFVIGEVQNDLINMADAKFSADASWCVKGLGVRPVIILKEDITEEELQIIHNTSEQWNYSINRCYIGTKDDYNSTGTEIFFY